MTVTYGEAGKVDLMRALGSVEQAFSIATLSCRHLSFWCTYVIVKRADLIVHDVRHHIFKLHSTGDPVIYGMFVNRRSNERTPLKHSWKSNAPPMYVGETHTSH